MRAEVTNEDGKWFGTVYDDDGSLIYRSKPESRPGCAARIAMNATEERYGRASTDKFVIDLGDW